VADERAHRDYRSFLHRNPCCCQPCVAAVVIHHHTAGSTEPHAKSLGGRRGKGQRASDDQGMPLCNAHHAQLHELRGYFNGWEKHQLREWQDKQVARLQRLYAMAHPEPIPASYQPRTGLVTLGVDPARVSAAERERRRIAAWLRDKAGARHLKVNEAAVLTDAASELEQQTGEF
jgi:hypothetical protein